MAVYKSALSSNKIALNCLRVNNFFRYRQYDLIIDSQLILSFFYQQEVICSMLPDPLFIDVKERNPGQNLSTEQMPCLALAKLPEIMAQILNYK